MPGFFSTIFYFDFKAFAYGLWANLKTFRFGLIVASFVSIVVLGLLVLLIILFRLVDEILFPAYRKTKIEKPVFIMSNPRSGTTYLHRLMTLDEGRFAYFKLYQTIGNSITFNKLIHFFGRIDKRIGQPLRRFFDWTDKVFFKGWKDIHPMGWNHSEEDEAQFVFSFTSPAVCLMFPYLKSYDWINFPDNYSQKKANKLMDFYENSLKRFMYSEGKGKQLLDKNVLSTGRVKLLLDRFPDAHIIYPVRNPYNTVPSLISMFTSSWKLICPFIPEDSEEYRQLGYLAIAYYKHWDEVSGNIPANRFYSISYDKLVESPIKVIHGIYSHFGMDISPEFNQSLLKMGKRNKNYVSKHIYSLEQYGMTKAFVYEQLKPIFKAYNFKQ